VSAGSFAAHLVFLTVPFSRVELRFWRRLRVRALRLWITRRRRVEEPLHREQTRRAARRNILWHLFFSALFSFQIAAALLLPGRWWQPLAPLLAVPCIAYLAGSVVQRQKLAIVELRWRRAARRSVP